MSNILETIDGTHLRVFLQGMMTKRNIIPRELFKCSTHIEFVFTVFLFSLHKKKTKLSFICHLITMLLYTLFLYYFML